MSQEDTSTKQTLLVRGNISAERLNAMLEKAGAQGYQLEFSIIVDPSAGAAPGEEAAPGEAAPERGDGDQDPR